MASNGGANAARGLAKQYGLNREKVRAGLEVLEPKEFAKFKTDIDGQGADAKNLFKPLLNKSESIIKKVFGNYKTVNGDVDAIADIQETLSQNKTNRGKKFLDDNQLEDAFTNANNFLERYKGKVSGAFTNRFGRAASTGNTSGLTNPRKLDPIQASGEIKTAEDILDGTTILENNVQMRGLPEITGQTNPDYLAILPDANTRLVEVKTLEGSFTTNKINKRFRAATEQIIGRVGAENIPISDKPSKNGYIRLDFRNADATGDTRDFLFETIEKAFKRSYTKRIEGNTINLDVTKVGHEVVEFAELIYKDKTNQVRSILAQFKNGVFTRLN
ncbi:MAG: hypothetical protein AAFQ91_24500 [Cyanobacteria bacterium J06621_15]